MVMMAKVGRPGSGREARDQRGELLIAVLGVRAGAARKGRLPGTWAKVRLGLVR